MHVSAHGMIHGLLHAPRTLTPGSVRNIAGIDFNFLQIRETSGMIDRWRRTGRRAYIALVNPHSVMTARRDSGMGRATDRADLVLPDGIGIILAARMLGYGRHHRVTGPALMLHIADAGRELGLRHFFYGGREGIAESLAQNLSEKYPGLQVAGTFCPPFRQLSESEDQAIVDQINASRADVIWVGMGAPKQEKWMAQHIGRIKATALIGVGAAFDFHSGNMKWAPGWVRKIGCEWAYRLLCEPRRMWRRNLDSPLFLLTVARQAVSRRIGRLFKRARPVLDSTFDGPFGPFEGGGGGGAVASGALTSAVTHSKGNQFAEAAA